MKGSLNRVIAVNTVSNYAIIAVRMLYVILITRYLLHYLGDDFYGFWSILWAFYTYIVIFNLGFGAALQKYTAEHLFERDLSKYNRIVAMVLASYVGVSLIVGVITLCGAYWMTGWTGLEDPEKISTCRVALLIFGGGMMILFPLSIFIEILTGLRLIYLKNMVMMALRVAEMGLVFMLIWLDAGFIAIVAFSVALNIFFFFLLWLVIKRHIRGFRLRARLDREIFKEIYNFSAFVYLNSVALLVIAKTDRFILSSILGMPAVTAYQIGTRMPEMSQMISSQFQDNVIPVTANLVQSGDTEKLKKILVSGMRFGVFMSLGATALFYALTTQTIQCLFAVESADMTAICHLFLISQFVYCAVRSVPYRYLQITGKHKFIAYTSVIQAAAGIALAVWLCHEIGVLGVAYAALIPNLIISAFVIFPVAMVRLEINWSEIAAIFVKPALAVIPSVLICVYAANWLGATAERLLPLTGIYAAASLVYAVAGWTFVLTKDERNFISAKIPFLKSFANR